MSAFFKWKDRFAESWTYDYPSLILRNRCQVNQGEGEFTAECVSPSGNFVGWRLHNSYAAYLNIDSGWFTLPLAASGNAQAHWLTKEWIVLSSTCNQACTLYILDYAERRIRTRVDFEEPDVTVSARLQGDRLVFCDDGGRITVLELGTGGLLREHRAA